MATGRNDPCPCGSGRKFKHCHANRPEELPAAPTPPARAPAPPVAAKRRQCGGCTACCGPLLRINHPDLVLPRGERCPHVCSAGCGLWHNGIPDLCKQYACQYLVEDAPLTQAERPDHLGALVQRRAGADILLAEWRSGGLAALLVNRLWQPMLRHHLLRGTAFAVALADDPCEAEALRVRQRDGALHCELAACDAQGAPRLVRVEPTYSRELWTTFFLPGQNFPFSADLLARVLGARDRCVLSPSRATRAELHFCLTRRQVEFLRAFARLLPHRAPAIAAGA